MAADAKHFDVVVIEATPAGIALAARAAREGMSVLLATRGQQIGGMLASGLGVWDTLIPGRRAPIYDEVREAIFQYYRDFYGEDSPQYRAALPASQGHANGRFEPSVATKILERLIASEPQLTVWRGVEPVAVNKEGARLLTIDLHEISTAHAHRVAATVFADCSYEGDFAALAGASFRVGRESRDEFGEPHAGRVHLRRATAPDSRLLALAERRRHWNLRRFSELQEKVSSPDAGKGDCAVQAFNYRTILCADPANRIPVKRPPRYDRGKFCGVEYDSLVEPLPNRKASWNRPQLPGRSFAYVTGDSAERRRIRDEHWDATLGLLYFLQTDPEIPLEVRRKWGEFGLARDEFADHAHRPYELYVREGRRIIGRRILTEHDTRPAGDFERAPLHSDCIGVTEWYVDIHVCGADRIGDSFGDGKMMLYVETVPGQVPYGALLPRGIDNLLVPVCLSATHVAFSAVRLEPTWMALGETAGFAAAQAVRTGRCPAALDTEALQRTLAARGVMLTFFNDVEPATAGGATLNAAAQFFGTKGFFPDYDAHPGAPLGCGVARVWANAARDPGKRNANDVARQVLAAEQGDPESIDGRGFAALLPPESRVQPGASRPITRGAALAAFWATFQQPPY